MSDHEFEPFEGAISHKMPVGVRLKSAARHSWPGYIGVPVALAATAPFLASPSIIAFEKGLIAAFLLVVVGIAAWSTYWFAFKQAITERLWKGGPTIKYELGAEGHYVPAKELAQRVRSFAAHWSKHPETKVEALKILEDVSLTVTMDPPLALRASGEKLPAIAFADSASGRITVWGAQLQNYAGVLDYELGHVLMHAEGYDLDVQNPKREGLWLEWRRERGLLSVAEEG